MSLGLLIFQRDLLRWSIQETQAESNDILGRIWCSVAQKYLGQPVVITNRAGGGGWQGFLDVKQAKPDGYTLLATSTG